MNENKYLPLGTHIANKYEIIDILGEDDFEILYLVRSIERKTSFFVVKELFLETFSSRIELSVYTKPEAVGVFNKRVKQIIEELKAQKLNPKASEIKNYGYEQENGTIYTVMGFSSNASVEKYLHFTPKEKTVLPELDNLLKKEKKKFDFVSFLLIALLLLTILGAIFYVYKYMRHDNIENEFVKPKEVVLKKHLQEKKIKPLKEEPIVQQISVVKEKPVVTQNIAKPVPINVPVIESTVVIEENNTVLEENITSIPKEIEEVKKVEVAKKIKVPKEEITKEELKIEKVKKEVNTRLLVKNFLDAYIDAISHKSSTQTLAYYDGSVKRYFKFKNPTHKRIASSQEKYNKKWKHRAFKLVDFEIVKQYSKNNQEYLLVKTLTNWTIKNTKGKKLSGESRGTMTLKKIADGFKITSIK